IPAVAYGASSVLHFQVAEDERNQCHVLIRFRENRSVPCRPISRIGRVGSGDGDGIDHNNPEERSRGRSVWSKWIVSISRERVSDRSKSSAELTIHQLRSSFG